MVPRLRFDISWRDLAHAARLCLVGSASPKNPCEVAFSPEAVVTLSVRSAFDLLLAALELPAGSEVLFSEVTVPHMHRIAREHALVPVSAPVDPRTLHISTGDVLQRLTPNTRLVVIAHLFGARAPLDDIGPLLAERQILLVEDCAQALVEGRLARDPAADVSLYSFGPIKTATALAGGVAVVKDEVLRRRMNEIVATWPEQSRWEYLERVMRIAVLKCLSHPYLLTPFVTAIEAIGGDADGLVGGSARGFSDGDFFEQLRKRPCASLAAMIAHRLQYLDPATIAARTRRGDMLVMQLGDATCVAGCDNPTHTYWVFPVVCQDPQAVCCALRAAGFDASQHSGLAVIEDEDPNHWFRRTVFVPHHAGVPERRLREAAALIRASVG